MHPYKGGNNRHPDALAPGTQSEHICIQERKGHACGAIDVIHHRAPPASECRGSLLCRMLYVEAI